MMVKLKVKYKQHDGQTKSKVQKYKVQKYKVQKYKVQSTKVQSTKVQSKKVQRTIYKTLQIKLKIEKCRPH
jgi:hypothetical protein